MESTAIVPTAPADPSIPESKIAPFISARRSPQTRRAYAADIKGFVVAMGLRSPDDLLTITPEDVVTYRDQLIDAGRSPSTVARKLSTLRSLFSYAQKRGWTGSNPADPKLVESPRVSTESTTEGLTREEARRLLDTVHRETTDGKRDYALLVLMLHHGLRRSEAADLTTSSFGSERNHITLTIKGKRGKVRKHAVKPSTLTAVEDYLETDGRTLGDGSPLFRPAKNPRTGDLAKAISAEGIRVILRKYRKRSGVSKRISPHSLRHTTITNALDNGATLRDVSYFAGHEDPKTTTRYDRNRGNLDRSAAYRIEY